MYLDDGRILVYGDDPPFDTLYAALYEPGKGRPYSQPMDNGPGAPTGEAPTKAIGYHPDEQALAPPGTEWGAFPAGFTELERFFIEVGLTEEQRERCGRRLADD